MTDQKPITQEDIDSVNKAIQEAKSTISTQEIEKVREQAKKEAEREALLKAAQEAAEAAKKAQEQLAAELERTKKESSEQLSQIQSRVDQLAGSRAAVSPADPFTVKPAPTDVDRWTDEKVNRVEEASARAFFGPDYDTALRASGLQQ